jgi:hypothetical protein
MSRSARAALTAIQRQAQQDVLAASQPAAAAAAAPQIRAMSKASGLYRNASWDLVDAVVNEKTVKLEDVKEASCQRTSAK